MENWQHLIPELTSVFPHLTQSTDDEIKDLLNAGNNLPLTTSNVDEKIARYQRNPSKYRAELADIEALKKCSDVKDWKMLLDFLLREQKMHRHMKLSAKPKTYVMRSPVVQTDIQLPPIHDQQPSPSSIGSSEKENEIFATNSLFAYPSSNKIESVAQRKSVQFSREVQKISPQRDPIFEITLKDIIRQLIAALQGIPSSFFEVNPSVTAFYPSPFLEKNIDCSLLERVGKLLSLCTYVLSLKSLRSFKAHDLIWQMFAFALDNHYTKYLSAVSEQYNEFLQAPDSFDLSRLEIFETIWVSRLQRMGDLATIAKHLSGMEVLNYVYIKFATEADSMWNKNMLEKVMQEMFTTFHDLLIKWLLNGELNDNNHNWLIKYDSVSQESRQWKRYILTEFEKIPLFLRNSPQILEKILSIGRTVHFIMQARGTSSYDKNFQERSQIIKKLDPKKIYYDLSEQGSLREALEKLNDLVVGDIMEDLRSLNNLGDHLSAIQIHFLLNHYVFASSILPGILRAMQSRIKMYNRIENTPANITNAAVKYAIKLGNTFAGLNIGPSFISGAVRETNESFQDVADYDKNLVLVYNAPGSVFMILSESVLTKYSEVFRKLRPIREIGFKFDQSYTKLEAISKQIFRHSKDLMPILRCFHFAYFFFGQFIKKVLYFIYHDIIPTQAKRLIKQVNEAKSVEKIEAEHTRFIDSIIEALFLKPNQKDIREVLKACLKYVNDLTAQFEDFSESWHQEMRRRIAHMPLGEAGDYLHDKKNGSIVISEDEKVERENACSVIYSMTKPYIVNLIIGFQENLKNMVYLMEVDESLHGNHLFLQLQLLCSRCLNRI